MGSPKNKFKGKGKTENKAKEKCPNCGCPSHAHLECHAGIKSTL